MDSHNIFNLIKKIFLRIRSRLLTEYTIMYLYPHIYKKYSKNSIDGNKIIFIESRLSHLSNSFSFLYDKLYKETDYQLETHFLRKTFVSDLEYINNCKKLIKDMATCKYVFMDEATHIFAKIKLRPETNLVQLWHGCGAFKKFGYSVSDGKFGASKRAKTRYPVHTNYTLVTVSSDEVIPHYEEAMNQTEKNTVKATGVSRTDIFYNKDFISESKEKFKKLTGDITDKKVILYAPTFRGNIEAAEAPDKLDFNVLAEKLSDRYILVIKHHPLVKNRPDLSEVSTKGFVYDFLDAMSIEELICVSDICISDYSSLVFEFSLFERPMIFFAYDLDEYFDSRGFYYDYNELTPGPVYKTTDEVVEYINNIDEKFDKSKVISFRRKYMSSCDGNATERIIREVFSDSYNQHLKK